MLETNQRRLKVLRWSTATLYSSSPTISRRSHWSIFVSVPCGSNMAAKISAWAVNLPTLKHGKCIHLTLTRPTGVDFSNCFYGSRSMLTLIFEEFQKDHMTLLLQKHAFRYLQYLTTQTDPKWPIRARICNYLHIYNNNWRRHARKIIFMCFQYFVCRQVQRNQIYLCHVHRWPCCWSRSLTTTLTIYFSVVRSARQIIVCLLHTCLAKQVQGNRDEICHVHPWPCWSRSIYHYTDHFYFSNLN